MKENIINNKAMPLISIIVPVYNAEKYLRRCIDSVLVQTYENWELVLVDDGSKDGSGKICDEYAAKDSRIKVLHQPNKGVGAARNLGLLNVRGKYLTFIDSDDYIDPDYLQNYVDNIEAAYDMIVQRIRCLDLYGKQSGIIGYDTKKVFTNDLEIDKEYTKMPFLPSCINKLYKTAYIKKYEIKFITNANTDEDRIFNIEISKYIKSLIFIPTVSYNIVMVPDSLTRRKYIAPMEFFNVAKKMDEMVGECSLGKEMDYYTAYIATKCFVRAMGYNLIYPCNVISLRTRLSTIADGFLFIFASNIIHKYNVRTLEWVHESLTHYFRKVIKHED